MLHTKSIKAYCTKYTNENGQEDTNDPYEENFRIFLKNMPNYLSVKTVQSEFPADNDRNPRPREAPYQP
jgi:hypothetical protein